MANLFFSLYTGTGTGSSLSLLLLLGLFLRADGAAIDTVCAKTTQPALCKTLLVSINTGSPTASLPELGEIAITADRDAAGKIKMEVQEVILKTKDGKLKSRYVNCENLYLDAIDQLLLVGGGFLNRRYDKILGAAGLVNRAYSSCAPVLANNPGLKQMNENARILADAIVVIVNNLNLA